MRKSCKHTHTHSHRAYFTENILNIKTLASREKKKFLIYSSETQPCFDAVKELAIPFCIISAAIQHYWSKFHTAFTLHQISQVLLTVSLGLYLCDGAPPLRVAAQEALHHHITALPVGTHRAMLETSYFFFGK